MKPSSLAVFVAAVLLPACGSPQSPTSTAPTAAVAATAPPASSSADAKPTADARFDDLAAHFLAKYLELAPVEATTLGDHTHDGTWPDPSQAGDATWLTVIDQTRQALAAIPHHDLGDQRRIDASILTNEMDRIEFSIRERRPHERAPISYTGLIGEGLDALVSRDFLPLPDRMKSLRGRLAGVPALVGVAKARLGRPSKVNTETAIRQNKGLIGLVERDLPKTFAQVPDQQADLDAAAKAAAAALHDLQTFFENELLPRSDGSFRVGPENFAKALRYSVDDDIPKEDLATAGRAALTQAQDDMGQTAKEIWPTVSKDPLPDTSTPAKRNAFVRKVLDLLAADRSTNATIVADAKQVLADATKFVAANDLVRVPDEPCEVIEMPEFKRGVSIAYCDSSGPLEKKQQTFVAIAPTPSDWPPAKSDSFYREYDKSMLADLIVHEAMPGHYLQGMHSNRFRSEIREVFSNGAMVEGWAVYTEWLMAKYGFGGPKVRLQRLKMWARVCANAILDHDIHAGTMDEKQALDLMMNDAFQEEGEAAQKWNRARLSAGQLSTYFYGFTELMKIRAAAEKTPGFTERAYHDRLLSFGSPAVRYLRPLMLGAQ